jgi:hypothetical protein
LYWRAGCEIAAKNRLLSETSLEWNVSWNNIVWRLVILRPCSLRRSLGHKEARQAGRTIDVDAETESESDESASSNAYEDAGTIVIDDDSAVEQDGEEENFIDDDSDMQENFDARILPGKYMWSTHRNIVYLLTTVV